MNSPTTLNQNVNLMKSENKRLRQILKAHLTTLHVKIGDRVELSYQPWGKQSKVVKQPEGRAAGAAGVRVGRLWSEDLDGQGLQVGVHAHSLCEKDGEG